MKTRLHIATAALLVALLVPAPALAEVSIGTVTTTVSTTDEGLLSAAMLRVIVASILSALGAR